MVSSVAFVRAYVHITYVYPIYIYIYIHTNRTTCQQSVIKYSFTKDYEVSILFYVIMALVFQHADCLIRM